MPDEKIQLEEMKAEITRLRSDLDNVSQQFFKNNFTSTQTFTKKCIFTAGLQVPHYSSAPSVGTVGDLIEVGGVLYICTTAGSVSSPATFTAVGTQS